MVQKRETKAINKLCVREILSLSFVCGRPESSLLCYCVKFQWQIRAGSREGTHAYCVFHACSNHLALPRSFVAIKTAHQHWHDPWKSSIQCHTDELTTESPNVAGGKWLTQEHHI